MMIQHKETYGLSRSPILAHFQKMPKTLPIVSNRLIFQARANRKLCLPISIPIHDAREDIVGIRTRAYQEQQCEEQRLEVEKRGLAPTISIST